MDRLLDWVEKNCKFAAERRTCVSIAILRDTPDGRTEALIGLRKSSPYAGQWALPGGWIESGETPQTGAKRELREETGLSASEFVKIEEEQRKEGKHICFASYVSHGVSAHAGTDIGAVKWVDVDKVPGLAFNDNASIRKAVSRLKSREKKAQKLASKKDKGILIVFEGIDGSGKTSQTEWLIDWLEENDYPVVHTKWNSSERLHEAIADCKDRREMTPMLFSLLHAADMLWRWEYVIKPALDKGRIVVCDRYYYTSLVRDSIRGVDESLVKAIYEDLREPDLVFHLVVPVEIAFSRVLDEKGLTYYGSGMDLKLSKNQADSCMKYEQMMDRAYAKLLPHEAKNYVPVDTDRSEKKIFKDIKEEVKGRFGIEGD